MDDRIGDFVRFIFGFDWTRFGFCVGWGLLLPPVLWTSRMLPPMVRYVRWPVPCIECRRSFPPLPGIRPALPGPGPLPLPGPMGPLPGMGALPPRPCGGAFILTEVRGALPGIGDLPVTLLALFPGLGRPIGPVVLLCPTGEEAENVLER
mmetsp:Transcript_22939/g.56523  ORF Transcript_22939/g.56523 Transcript_22939/m.56523 type:complete len:150 (-) Transcript_22939:479-928(-)